MAAPLAATAPPLARRCAALAGAALPRRWRGCGWSSLAVRSLASASGVALGGHAGLCPSGKAARVKIVGVHHASSVVLRGVLPRSSALRASGGGARLDAVRGSSPRAQPRLRSALRLRLRLRASFKSAETADFQRRLSVRAFQGHFSGSFGRFGGYKCPPRLHFTQKMASKGAARPPATRPKCLATRETRGHLLDGGLPARRGLWTAPGTVPTARTRSGLGSRPLGAPRHDLSIL